VLAFFYKIREEIAIAEVFIANDALDAIPALLRLEIPISASIYVQVRRYWPKSRVACALMNRL
jgi:hypothetical protein